MSKGSSSHHRQDADIEMFGNQIDQVNLDPKI